MTEKGVPSVSDKHVATTTGLPGSVFLIAGDGRMINLPIPSASPGDPLNWSLTKRVAIFCTMTFYSVVSLFAVQAPSLLLHAMEKEFTPEDTAPLHLESLSVCPTLGLGLGAIVWIPVSLAVGRRPVFLVSASILTLAIVWAGVSRGFWDLLFAVTLQGFAAGSALSAMLLVSIDITFIHERPQAIAVIWCVGGTVCLALLSLVPLMADTEHQWRPIYWTWALPAMISFTLAYFLVPETYFRRPPVAFDGRIVIQTGSEAVQIYDDPGEAALEVKPLPELPPQSAWRFWTWKFGISCSGVRWKSMFACYPQMLFCLCNPLIFWVMVLTAINFGAMMSIGITFPTVLKQEPYNLPPFAISLVNMAAAGGALLAWPASGLMATHITSRLARRNGGVRHAEYILPGFVLPILTGAISVFLYGAAVKYRLHYLWVYLAYALNAFSYAGMSVATTLWVTEAFPRWAAAALAVVGGVAYMSSFGISIFIKPWVQLQGFFWVNMELGILVLAVGFVGVPVAFWGKSVRQYLHGRWGEYEGGALRPVVMRWPQDPALSPGKESLDI